MAAVARVLVVQHDLVVLHRVSEALRLNGIEVDSVSSVSDALDALAHRTYDLLLADYDMPNIHGLDYLAALQGAAPTTPRILCAGLATDELRAQARVFGIWAVLAKSVAPERVVGTVGAALARGKQFEAGMP